MNTNNAKTQPLPADWFKVEPTIHVHDIMRMPRCLDLAASKLVTQRLEVLK